MRGEQGFLLVFIRITIEENTYSLKYIYYNLIKRIHIKYIDVSSPEIMQHYVGWNGFKTR